MNKSATSDEWRAARVLPNVELETAIEGKLIALAPATDARVARICADHPNFASFLGRFSGAFGEDLRPASIIVHRDAPTTLTVEGIAGFRDAITASIAPRAHALDLVHGAQGRMRFSDHFEIYPWMLDKDYDDLLLLTPAATGVHTVDEFSGQPSAVIFHRQLQASDLDDVVLSALLKRWAERYIDANDDWENRALFRSLNMANQAMLVPSGSESSLYDVGRSVAMWIAAFEILVHSGKGKVGWKQVVALIDAMAWLSPKASKKAHKSSDPKDATLYSLGAWLYVRLNQARNDFLHGNPVSKETLETPQGLNLVYFAAPLYRLALTSLLELEFNATPPSGNDSETLAAWISARIDTEEVQGFCEQSLLRAVEPKRAPAKRARFEPLDPEDDA